MNWPLLIAASLAATAICCAICTLLQLILGIATDIDTIEREWTLERGLAPSPLGIGDQRPADRQPIPSSNHHHAQDVAHG